MTIAVIHTVPVYLKKYFLFSAYVSSARTVISVMKYDRSSNRLTIIWQERTLRSAIKLGLTSVSVMPVASGYVLICLSLILHGIFLIPGFEEKIYCIFPVCFKRKLKGFRMEWPPTYVSKIFH